jgi:D-arabinose 1-dehydrogenase-like Zn-dependent alcohol dehydrogenase
MSKMRAIQVPKAHGQLELAERPIPDPGPGLVRVKVQACGICHSDSIVTEGLLPGIQYPRVPGHEVAGIVDAVGAGVEGWKTGQRAGIGWNGGYCGYCANCRRGNSFACLTSMQITGATRDGGYADYVLAPASALAVVPDGLSAVEAAPLMCAGVTTFNCLRHCGAGPGEVVAVLGLGGLGHLAIQFAAKMGFDTVAIARGADKEPLARKLGARVYIDSQAKNAAAELQKLGGAKAVIATATNSEAMQELITGLAPNGSLMVIGVGGPLKVEPVPIITGSLSVKGWYSGVASDAEDTMRFSVLTGVRSMNEVYPLERFKEGYERMLSGKAQFRVVLTTGN